MKRNFLLSSLLGLFVILSGHADDASNSATVRQIQQAIQKRDFAKAQQLCDQLIQASPQDANLFYLRGRVWAMQRKHAQAIADFDQALKLNPQLAAAYDARGDAKLKSGQITQAIADFDKFLAFEPKFRPEHWRLGIAYYYADRFADGVKLFELHRTVNPEDVENAVWHFLCNARATNLAKAREQLIPISGDTRVPMKEVHRLFAGKAQPQEVLAAAQKEQGEAKTIAMFYAHLYLALYYEALGDRQKTLEHLQPAVEKYPISHYMWDVAKVHWDRMQAKP